MITITDLYNIINKRCLCNCGEKVTTYHSKTRRFRLGHNNKYFQNINYKDRISHNSKGYKILNIYNKRIKLHRFIYEQHNKCCLLPNVIVHHINGIKDDNRIENLQPLYRGYHSHITNGFDNTNSRCCNIECKTPNKTYVNTSGKSKWYRDNHNNIYCRKCWRKLKYHKLV
jgi:hypothetical protein